MNPSQNAAEQQHTASADTCTPPCYTHTPHPPYILASAVDQRYYTRGNDRGLGFALIATPTQQKDAWKYGHSSIKVMRFQHDDYAQLDTSVRHGLATLSLSNADELRELAMRLLDAAHDLDQHPAATLTGGQ